MYRFFSASVVFWIFKSIQIQPNPISDHLVDAIAMVGHGSWSNRMSWGARQLGCNFDRAGWDLSWKMCLDLGLRIDMKPYDPYGTSKRLGKMSFQFDIFELITSRHFLNWNMWNFWCSRIQIGTQHWLTAGQVSEGEEALEWQQLSCKKAHQIRGPLNSHCTCWAWVEMLDLDCILGAHGQPRIVQKSLDSAEFSKLLQLRGRLCDCDEHPATRTWRLPVYIAVQCSGPVEGRCGRTGNCL